MRTSSIDPVTSLNQNDCKARSYEEFKNAGFKPINSTILQGKNRVYVYFLDGKPYILAPCNVMTEHQVGCCPENLSPLNLAQPMNWFYFTRRKTIEDHSIKESFKMELK